MRTATQLILTGMVMALLPMASATLADEPRLEDAKLLEVSNQDDDLTRLLTQRRNELLEAYRDMEPLFRAGRVSPEDIQSAALRFAKADVDAAPDQAGRVRGLELSHSALQTIERIVREKYENGAEPVQAMCRATEQRLSAEIQLLQARAVGLNEAEKAANANQLRTILKERRNAVAKEVAAHVALYHGGRTKLESTCDAIQRQAMADVESASTPAERVKGLTSAIDMAKWIEGSAEGKVASGAEPARALQRARFLRLDLEVALARVRETPPDNAEFQKALQARRDAAKEEVEALRGLYRGGRASLNDVAAAEARQGRAALDLADTSAARVKVLTALYDASVEIETIVREKFRHDNEPSQAMHQATAARLAAEIDLLRARRAGM